MFQVILDTIMVMGIGGLVLLPAFVLAGILENYIQPFNFQNSPKHDYSYNRHREREGWNR